MYVGVEYEATASNGVPSLRMSSPSRRLRLGDDIRSDGTPYDYVASYSTPSYTYSDPDWR